MDETSKAVRATGTKYRHRASAMILALAGLALGVTGAEAQTTSSGNATSGGAVVTDRVEPPKTQPPAPDALPGYVGVWIDDTGNGAIQLAKCGDKLCGRMVWLRFPLDDNGAPTTDSLNPTEAERHKPVCGLQVLGDLQMQADGSWDGGWIYDPKDGKTTKVALRLRASDRLEVTGYSSVKLLSETVTWKRAGARLPVCIDTAPEFRVTN